MRIDFLIILITLSSCLRQTPLTNEQLEDSEFTNYIGLFKVRTPPLMLDRKSVFDLSKHYPDAANDSAFIKASHGFLPDELSGCNTRPLFKLPIINKVTPVLIAKGIFEEDEQRILKIYLITYSDKGQLIDFVEIAGYSIDLAEKFTKIDENFSFITWTYQYKKPPNDSITSKFYLVETTRTYNISQGKIIKAKENSREGYFDGDGKGYIPYTIQK